MGTNYYALIDPCEHCGHSNDRIHLGKSSAGWKFHFREQDEYDSFTMFREFIRRDDVLLKNEYGEEVKPSDLIKKIERKDTDENNDPLEEARQRDYNIGKFRKEEWRRGPDGHVFHDREFS